MRVSTSTPTSRACRPALLGRDDVVLLPHIGSATIETRQAMVELTLANVDRFLADGTLLTPVPV